MNYKRLYYKYKTKYLGGSNCQSPTNNVCNENCSEADNPCYEDPIDMECYPKKDMKCLSDNTYYSKNIISKWPNTSPFTRAEWTQEDREKMSNLPNYPIEQVHIDPVHIDPVDNGDTSDEDFPDIVDENSIFDEDWDNPEPLEIDNSYIKDYHDNRELFYNDIGREPGDYIYLIGGGNDIKSLHKYTDLQNDRGGRHVFQGEFIDGPPNYQTTDLNQAFTYFKDYPSKDDYGVSLSICFVPCESENVSVAYCLLAYNYDECGYDSFPTDVNDSMYMIEIALNNLTTEPLPSGITIDLPEFTI